MKGLPAVGRQERKRTRHWVALILGGALPGLVSAVVLGMRGARVLVLEERASARRHPSLREPFFMTGAARDSVLGACLRALGVPLIDQRRVEIDPLAFQIVCPGARPEVGEQGLTADEWAAWGLAQPEAGGALARALAAAGDAEREAMLAAPLFESVLRPGWRARRGRTAVTLTPAAREPRAQRPRGVPPELASAPPAVAALLAAQVRALSNLGEAQPTPEARARLLGAPLEGAGRIAGRTPWLADILRRRIRALHGEFRILDDAFRLVSSANQPGIAQQTSEEVWVGRVFVVNAVRPALAAAVAQEPVPAVLRSPPATRRRVALRLRVARRVFPEGMAARVLHVGDLEAPMDEANVVTLRSFPRADDPEQLDVVAAAVAAPEDGATAQARIEAIVSSLMPFADGGIARENDPVPRWDDDAWLVDPSAGTGWPDEPELRLHPREPIYQLDRAAVAGLGVEGELLLGWRAGEAIAAELA
jgi:hypothetical protein